MANRLTEDPNVSVAVVEAGTWAEDVVGNKTEVPAYDVNFTLKAANATRSGVDWGFVTTPQPVSLRFPLAYWRELTISARACTVMLSVILAERL